MRFENISVPEIYKESSDFRLFLKWFVLALTKIQHDTDNLPDLYDPLKCPDQLLWMLADTMGFKYDDRLPIAFNRLVLLYFMSMIRNRGSKDGVTLAAEINLAQFNILDYGKENDILYNRLEDTSIPVNSVYVTPHTAEGYIDIVYFSDTLPVDSCIEYVRPVGMYLFTSPGVRFDARTKISIDARLTNMNDVGVSLGTTRVGQYSRRDYASLQKTEDNEPSEGRSLAWYRNSKYEGEPTIDAGYRALSSLQLCNNEHVFKSLIRDPNHKAPDPIFGIGYGPTEVEEFAEDLNKPLKPIDNLPYAWNLRYDRSRDDETVIQTIDPERESTAIYPNAVPQVNPIMYTVGDAIAMEIDVEGVPTKGYTKIKTTFDGEESDTPNILTTETDAEIIINKIDTIDVSDTETVEFVPGQTQPSNNDEEE